MKRIVFIILLLSFAFLLSAENTNAENQDKQTEQVSNKRNSIDRFQIGGYGEIVGTYNFFSDEYLRYTDAKSYANAPGHGRVDIPHFVIWMGYDFGKGWSLGAEIEFEHGGTESAVEIETEEAGEYESEVSRGGEVALE